MAEVKTVDGDHKIRDESVDVDSSVGEFDAVVCGRQERDVIPASCPMRRASNVTENNCALGIQSERESDGKADRSNLPEDDLTVRMWRLRDMERPPSPVSSKLTREASNASNKSSASPAEFPDAPRTERENGSMFHRRMVASWDPEARIKGSASVSVGLKARLLTQSSCPGSVAAGIN